MTNGNRTVAYVIKFLLIHAQPLLLWSCTVPVHDGDCTGQLPGVYHVCESVGMEQGDAHCYTSFWGCMSIVELEQ